MSFYQETKINKFLDDVVLQLSDKGIEFSELQIDHIAYNAASLDDYELEKLKFKEFATIVHENIVGGKHVAVFLPKQPFEYRGYKVEVVEVVSPKEGETTTPMWEHVEFLPNKKLEDFMLDHSGVEWDTSAMDRDIFPQLMLKLEHGLRAKFPRRGVLEEVERLK